MKKKAVIAAMVLMVVLCSGCQQTPEEDENLVAGPLEPRPAESGGVADMSEVELAVDYSGETWFCVEDGLWGLLDSSGNVVVEPAYTNGGHYFWEEGYYYEDGYLLQDVNGYYHRFDAAGKELWDYTGFMKSMEASATPVEYSIEMGGFVVTAETVQVFYDFTEREIPSWDVEEIFIHVYDMGISYRDVKSYIIKEHGKYGLVDLDGNRLLPSVYEEIQCTVFNRSVESPDTGDFYVTAKLDGLWGLYDSVGRQLTGHDYDSITFSDGAYVYSQGDGYGLLDLDGNAVTPPEYEMAGWYVSDGLRAMRKGGKWGVVTESGQVAVDFLYDEIRMPSGYIIVEKDGWQDILNEDGEPTYGWQYTMMYRQPEEGHIVKKGGLYGFINPAGEEVIPFLYKDLDEGGPGHLIGQTERGEWQVLTMSGEVVYLFEKASRYQIAHASELADGRALIEIVDENAQGLLLIEKEKDAVWVFPPEMEWVRMHYLDSDESGYSLYTALDKDGGLWIASGDMKARKIGEFSDVKNNFRKVDFTGGQTKVIFTVEQDGKWGAVNDLGQIVVPFEYDEMHEFNWLGYAAVQKDGKWGSVNYKGEVTAEPQYIFDVEDEYLAWIGRDFLKDWYIAHQDYYVSAFIRSQMGSEAFGDGFWSEH